MLLVPGMVQLELLHQPGIGPPPGVDGLVGVRGDGDGAFRAGHQADQSVLDRGDVLELVHQQMAGADLRPGFAEVRVGFQGVDGVGDDVVQVQGVLAELLLGVTGQHIVPGPRGRRDGLAVMAGLVEPLPVEKAFHFVGAELELRVVGLPAQLGDGLGGLLVIPDRVVGGDADDGGAGLPEEEGGVVVQGADEDVGRGGGGGEFVADLVGDAGAEGYVSYGLRRHAALQQAQDAAHQGVGLAGAWAAQDQEGAQFLGGGGPLLVVQRPRAGKWGRRSCRIGGRRRGLRRRVGRRRRGRGRSRQGRGVGRRGGRRGHGWVTPVR